MLVALVKPALPTTATGDRARRVPAIQSKSLTANLFDLSLILVLKLIARLHVGNLTLLVPSFPLAALWLQLLTIFGPLRNRGILVLADTGP